jgi:hypothetical protein
LYYQEHIYFFTKALQPNIEINLPGFNKKHIIQKDMGIWTIRKDHTEICSRVKKQNPGFTRGWGRHRENVLKLGVHNH